MELLEKMNQDIFNEFKNDELKDLSSIRGGTCDGRSGGAIINTPDGERYCSWDEGDPNTQVVCVWHNCSTL